MAATQETALFDFVANGAPLAFLGAGGYLAPSTIVSPGLLFDELEFEPPREELPKEDHIGRERLRLLRSKDQSGRQRKECNKRHTGCA